MYKKLFAQYQNKQKQNSSSKKKKKKKKKKKERRVLGSNPFSVVSFRQVTGQLSPQTTQPLRHRALLCRAEHQRASFVVCAQRYVIIYNNGQKRACSFGPVSAPVFSFTASLWSSAYSVCPMYTCTARVQS